MAFEIDLNDFTLGEVEEIEQVAGVYFRDLFSSNKHGAGIAACLWVLKRRTNPDYTLADAKAEKLRDIHLVFNDDDADPTSGSDSETT